MALKYASAKRGLPRFYNFRNYKQCTLEILLEILQYIFQNALFQVTGIYPDPKTLDHKYRQKDALTPSIEKILCFVFVGGGGLPKFISRNGISTEIYIHVSKIAKISFVSFYSFQAFISFLMAYEFPFMFVLS